MQNLINFFFKLRTFIIAGLIAIIFIFFIMLRFIDTLNKNAQTTADSLVNDMEQFQQLHDLGAELSTQKILFAQLMIDPNNQKTLDQWNAQHNTIQKLTNLKIAGMQEAASAHEQFIKNATRLINHRKNNPLNKVSFNSALEDANEVQKYLKNAVFSVKNQGNSNTANLKSHFNNIDPMTKTVETVMVLVIICFIFIFSRSIAKPVAHVTNVAKGIAKGDISIPLNIHSRGEIGEMAQAFRSVMDYIKEMSHAAQAVSEGNLTLSITPRSNMDVMGTAFAKMTEGLKVMLLQIKEAAQLLANQSENLLTTAKAEEKLTETEAAALLEASTTLEELSASQRQVSENARNVTFLAEQTGKAVIEGESAVDSTLERLKEIKSKSEGIAERTLQLSRKAQEIGKITITIKEITEQINLLAVNAAIEAARAGEEGKGFAVVASEIRRLSERADRAAEDISQIIEDMQSSTHLTVLSTEEGMKAVDAGFRAAGGATETFNQIRKMVMDTVTSIKDVLATVEEQDTATQQINQSIQDLDEGMRQALISMKELVKAAGELDNVSKQFMFLVERFKLGANGSRTEKQFTGMS